MLDVAVVGGGPGGLAAANAVLLANDAVSVCVFERASQLRRVGFTLGLGGNGFAALLAIHPHICDRIKGATLPDGPVVFYNNRDEEVTRIASLKEDYRDINPSLGSISW